MRTSLLVRLPRRDSDRIKRAQRTTPQKAATKERFNPVTPIFFPKRKQ